MKYVKVIIGSLVVALTLNFFILPYGFISFGTDGLGFIFNNITILPAAFSILIINMIIILGSLMINPKNSYKYLLPSLLIPVFMYATSFINVDIVLPERVLAMVISAVFIGVGYTFIFQSGYKAGTIFLLEEDIGDITKIHAKIYSCLVDVMIIFVFMAQKDFQAAIYSMFIIVIARLITNKARYNINDSKMFYVITTKEREVKDYIIRTLGYELTELDVKGGFSQEKKSILLSVIASSDYYRLKSGIIKIDSKAFVAITDTYDVINRKAF
jgi:uncharacterized membrane-anchored protein YitT (DUF2179 family)